MKQILLSILFLSGVSFTQQSDSIKTFQLQEVIVIGNDRQSDDLMDFYKVNTPSTTEEILSRSQSVNMIRRGNYGLEPTIRGFSAGQINLTIDGMHIQCACTDKMDPITIYVEPQNLYSIDVMTFSNGLPFGSTVGGSVNFQFANPIYNQTSMNSSVGYQSAANAYNGNFTFNTGNDKLALRLNGVYRKSNNYRAGNGEIIPFSYYKKTNFSLNANYSLSENEEIKSAVLFDDGWNIGYPALPMDVGYAKARIYSLSFSSLNTSDAILSIDGKIYANSITHFMDDTKRPSVPMHMDMPGWSNTYGGYVEGQLDFASDHITKLKAEVYRTDVRAEMTMYPPEGEPMFMLTLPDTRRWFTSLFVKDDWNFAESYFLSASARIEYINSLVTSEFGRQQLSVFGFDTEQPKNILLLNGALNFTKQINDKFDVSAILGYTERAPSFNEAYGFYLFNSFDGYDYIGNPELNVEQSLNTEIVFQYYSDLFDLKAAGFYNQINNYMIGIVDKSLSAMTIEANGVKVYNNINYAIISGTELSLFIRPVDNLKSLTTLKYQIGKDNNSEPLALISPLKILTSLTYQIKKLGLQGEIEYAAPQNNVRASVGEQKTASYLLLHLRLSYNLPFNDLSLLVNAGVENLFDANYRDHLDYGSIPRPGRNIYASISFNY